jgi:hypothetical protein
VYLGALLAQAGCGWCLHAEDFNASTNKVSSSVQDVRSVRIPRISRAPKIDDFVNGTEREAEAVINDFRQRAPNDGKPASRHTTAYLSYDDYSLYVVFVCEQPPSSIRGHLSKRDDISNDDNVSVYMDTFRDHQHAYVFTVNPAGVQSDGILTEGHSELDFTFDTLWYSSSRVTSNSYVVWIRIPFMAIRFAHTKEQSWNIALGRSYPKNSEYSFWPYITTRQNGFAQQMAKMEGLDNISPGRNIQVTPYGIYTFEHSLLDQTPPLATQNVGRAGADVKAIIRDAFTLDATLNPDFSQVESDDPQVTVNQRYRVYFPEKRPFFLDNASYFQVPIDLFFTRNIADPQFGARLTGTVNQWALGVFASDDRAPGEGLEGGNSLANYRAADVAISVHKEFSNQSTLGFLAISYNFGSASNQVVSVDARERIPLNSFITGQWAQSFDQHQGGTRTSGHSSLLDFSHTGYHFKLDSNFSHYSPDFNAPLGFIKRVDISSTSHYLNYLWKPESGLIVDIGPRVGALVDWDHTNKLQDWNASAGFAVDLRGSTGLGYTRYQIYERYLNEGFHYDKNEYYLYAGWLKWLYLSASVLQGSGVNYQPAETIAPFAADTIDGSFTMSLRPSQRLRVDEIYYYDRLKQPGANVVYTDHFWRTKVNFQFNRELSVRAITDYSGVLSNATLFSNPTTKQLTGDVLLTYMLHPGTALYVGYNNQHQNWKSNADMFLEPEGGPTDKQSGLCQAKLPVAFLNYRGVNHEVSVF